MNYTLNINIDPADLSSIMMSGNQVQLYSITDNGTAVVWLAFNPLVQNTITWTEQYEIYVSNTQVVNGASVNIMASTNASPQNLYTWTGMSFNTQPAPALGSTQYMLGNSAMPMPHATLGLAKAANVNGMQTGNNPVNATEVMANATIITGYQPRVFLAIGNQQQGTIASTLPHNGCYVDYTGASSLTAQYAGGQFIVT